MTDIEVIQGDDVVVVNAADATSIIVTLEEEVEVIQTLGAGPPGPPGPPGPIGEVPASRSIIAGTGLTGGGDLSLDRTLALTVPVAVVNGGTGTTSGISTGTQAALDGKVAKAGDTMSGDLQITKISPALRLDRTTADGGALIGSVLGTARWAAYMGSDDEGTDPNGGSHFYLRRYNNAGAHIDTPITILRNDGKVILNGDPTSALHAATKNYADLKVAKAGDTMSGALLIQQGSSPSSWGNQPAINIGYISAGSRPGIVLRPSADPGNAMNFVNNADGAVGSITTSATATAYNTSSDIRLKEGLETFDAGRIVDATEVFSFKWKSAPTGERSYGVSAQQAQEVFPQAVTYDSAADWYGIDYSKYVPVLLQELKSLRVRVAQLEAQAAPK